MRAGAEGRRAEQRGQGSGYVCFRAVRRLFPRTTASLPEQAAPPSKGRRTARRPAGLTNYRRVISLFPPVPPRTAVRQVAQRKLHEFHLGPGRTRLNTVE